MYFMWSTSSQVIVDAPEEGMVTSLSSYCDSGSSSASVCLSRSRTDIHPSRLQSDEMLTIRVQRPSMHDSGLSTERRLVSYRVLVWLMLSAFWVPLRPLRQHPSPFRYSAHSDPLRCVPSVTSTRKVGLHCSSTSGQHLLCSPLPHGR